MNGCDRQRWSEALRNSAEMNSAGELERIWFFALKYIYISMLLMGEREQNLHCNSAMLSCGDCACDTVTSIVCVWYSAIQIRIHLIKTIDFSTVFFLSIVLSCRSISVPRMNERP